MKPQGSLATLSISAAESRIRKSNHDSHNMDTYSFKESGYRASESEHQRGIAPSAKPDLTIRDDLESGAISRHPGSPHLQRHEMLQGSRSVSVQQIGTSHVSGRNSYIPAASYRSVDTISPAILGTNKQRHSSQPIASSNSGQRSWYPLQQHQPAAQSHRGSSYLDPNSRGIKRGSDSPARYTEESVKRPRLDGEGFHGRIRHDAEAVTGIHSQKHDSRDSGASRQRTLTMMDQNLARRNPILISGQPYGPDFPKTVSHRSLTRERSAEISGKSDTGCQQNVSARKRNERQDMRSRDFSFTKYPYEDEQRDVSIANSDRESTSNMDQLRETPLNRHAPTGDIAISIEDITAQTQPKVSPDTKCGALNSDTLRAVIPQERQRPLRNSHLAISKGERHKYNLAADAKDIRPQPTKYDKQGSASVPQFLQNNSSALIHTSISDPVELALKNCLADCASETEYWNRISLARARRSKHPNQAQAKISDEADEPVSFARLKPLDLTSRISKNGGHFMQLRVENNLLTRTAKSKWTVPCSKYSTQEVSDEVPEWAHYVSLKANILSYNNTTLQTLPYFGDEFDMADELGQDLKLLYNLDISGREEKVKRLLQAERLEEFVDEALEKIGCDWESVLQVFLDPSPEVGSDLEARGAIARREEWYDEAILKGEERVSVVLSRLPPSDHEKNAKAAVFCEHFHNVAGFTLWQIARRHNLVKPHESQPDKTIADRVCGICYTEFCTEHGELREYDDEASDRGYDSATGEEHALSTDIVHPLRVNFRIRSKFALRQPEGAEPVDKPGNLDNRRRDPRRLEYWMDSEKYERMVELRKCFYPCYHPNQTCDEAQCSCVRQRVMCEKSCGCAQNCPRRFRGCACKTNNEGSVCFQDDRCVCFALWRECDPDLCGGCGVSEVLAPGNRHDDSLLVGRCANAGLQRGKAKHTILGESSVHGLGLYACEDIKPHEFVGEYRGEIITKQEAERRGVLQKILDLSYLFNINADQEVDATYMGNKTRFINHLKYGKANLVARIALVDTVHRIALYADKPIKAGDELFFDYGPEFPEHSLGGKAPAKSAPRARNTRDVASFYDAEVEEDEAGNRRVKKTMRGRPRKDNGKQSKSKAGVRTNTSRKNRTGLSKKPRPRRRIEEEDDDDETNDEVGVRDVFRANLGNNQETGGSNVIIEDDSIIKEVTTLLEMDDEADADFRPDFNARDTSSESDNDRIADSEEDSYRKVARKTVRGLRGPATRARARSRDRGTEESN